MNREWSANERQTNPFATRWIRPGAIPYQFPAGLDVSSLVARLCEANWRGAIIGPHGTGKSTLLQSLMPALEQAGHAVHLVGLRDGQRRLLATFKPPTAGDRGAIVIVDGYEQLGWWLRLRLKWRCRRHGWGLVVTAHAPCGLPELYRTRADLSVLQAIVEDWLPDHGGSIESDDVAAALVDHRGNMREALFSLYDLFEVRRAAEPAK